MNKWIKGLVMTIMNFGIIATVAGIHFVTSQEGQEAYAQGFRIASPSNSTDLSPLSNLSMTNQTGESLVESFGSPQSLMEAVIREAENTNATDFAARQLIETTRSTMLNDTSNMTGMTGTTNTTGDTTNDTAMRAVIEQTVNTNATGFAADNVINMTDPQTPRPQDSG